jgi:hypothetical protein
MIKLTHSTEFILDTPVSLIQLSIEGQTVKGAFWLQDDE